MARQTKKRNTRTYSADERASALTLAAKMGPSAAGKKVGIPSGTIACWQTLERRKLAKQAAVEAPPSSSSVPTPMDEQSAPPQVALGSTPPKRRIAKIYTPSERKRAIEYVDKFGASKASKLLGISRWSLYDWARKARLEASGKIVTTLFSGSDADPYEERDERIMSEWKRHPGLGPSQIRNQLRRNGLKTSVSTVRRVMMENGYVPPKVKRKNVHDQNYEAIRPNHLWHMDFLHRYINKKKIYVLLIVDDHSRFIPGYAITDAERVDVVMNAFERAVNRYGKPEMVMSDGGSAFYAWRGVSRFTKLLEEFELDQLIADVPQKNGKLEVLNANVQKELFNQEKFFDLAQTELRLRAWIDFYNFRRTHHALGGLLVPADRYFGRADDVLAQIESGCPPDGVGEPAAIGERVLDLLRVTSQKGEVSFSLMGKQVWPA